MRNNGGNYGADYIHDRLASSATEGLGLDYQHGRGAVVYYNGEYYGIHNIRERSTEYYFETNYGMDPDAIDLLKAGNEVTAGSSTDYVAMMDWLESNHLNTNENYEKIAEQVDVENFMNYVQTELYVDNRDWPANNLKKWRCTNPKTKWKWFLYDLDFGFGNGYSEYKNNIFEYATNAEGPDYPNGPASTLLLRRLLENENFKMAFINRMSVLLSMNFEKTRMLSLISSMMAEIQSEIPKDQQRWKLNSAYMNNRLASIKKFVGERQDILLAEMQDFFNLGEQTNVNLSVEGSGKILVHNLPIDRTSMTIPFFKGTPIVLTAQANGGSVFTGWSDGEIANSRTILPEEASFLKAVFK